MRELRRTVLTSLILSLIVATSLVLGQANEPTITASTADISLLIDETETVDVRVSGLSSGEKINLQFFAQHTELIRVEPTSLILDKNDATYKVNITGLSPGHLELTSNYTSAAKGGVESIFFRITVAVSNAIKLVSEIVGWVYFVAWSVSFYPQIYINFKRKSVVGLNFDFVALNIVGFVMYSMFNIGLYWIPEVEKEYLERHPRGLNPVLPNDIGFGVHAVFATLVTIVQCMVYERAEQRVSTVARSIMGVFAAALVVFFVLVFTETWHWLDFLYACSYIKLTITLIKYIPQALMNYRRKSTTGWSIGNILLDFTGGVLSMLQMILNAYNYDDWNSLFGDPTKFGLGLFSVLFDILFMVQHYILYRYVSSHVYDELKTTDEEEEETLLNRIEGLTD